MDLHPLVDVPLHLTESCSIHLTRQALGDQRTARLSHRLLSAEEQRRMNRRHPNQSRSLAEARYN